MQDREFGDNTWRTAKKSSSTTRTRATWAASTRTIPSVGTGLVGAPACGDVMKLQIKVSDDGVIEDAKFKTFGCGSAIASSSLATEWIKGKTVDQAMEIKNTQIVEELNLPPVKIHCSVLAEDAIKSAIADYKKKQASGNKHLKESTVVSISVSERAVQEIQQGRGQADDRAQGAAGGHPRRRLHRLLVLVRVVGQRSAPRGQGAGASETGSRCGCSSIRRASCSWTARRWTTRPR